jgi:DNA-binding MarR family transcriptional regulator
VHAINFQVKRAHLSILAAGRAALRKLGKRSEMTPARFDLLFAIRQVNIGLNIHGYAPVWGHRCLGLKQNELTRRLGVSRKTVSKMLKRLEQMGWIEREVPADDRRTKYVSLTALGLQKIWYAMRRIFRGRVFLAAYEKFFKPIVTEHILVTLFTEWSKLEALARNFGDRSSLVYEFWPEVQY